MYEADDGMENDVMMLGIDDGDDNDIFQEGCNDDYDGYDIFLIYLYFFFLYAQSPLLPNS